MLVRLAQALALSWALAVPAMGQSLPAPKGEIILTITGDIKNTNAEGAAVFDLEMLQSLPAHEFDTETIWTEGTHTFSGVSLGTLLKAVGAEGVAIRATALNDYAVEIPMTDATDGSALIAYHFDGAEMSVREKGPLWVVYPYSSNAKYRSEVIYSRSIWQLDRLEVIDEEQ